MTQITINETDGLYLIINFIGLNNAIISILISWVAPAALSLYSIAVPIMDIALLVGYGVVMLVFGINLFIVVMLDAYWFYRKYLSKYHFVVEKE